MGMLRLRQIALVAHDRDAVVAAADEHLGIAVAFNDPGVDVFGLHNAVMPVGDQFIEVVAPIKDGTAGGRYLDRRGGDGGYMVILQADEHAGWKQHVQDLGIRMAMQHDGHEYKIMQLHPADTGGSFLEIDEQIGGEDPTTGPWEPAGPDWQAARRTGVVTGIAAAELQSPDPTALATRWSQILQRPITDGPVGPEIALDNATLRFVRAEDGRGEGLGGIDLTGTGASTDVPMIGGVRITIV